MHRAGARVGCAAASTRPRARLRHCSGCLRLPPPEGGQTKAVPPLPRFAIAVRSTGRERYFVSEASAYGLLAARDLIAGPAFIVAKAADEFHTKTTAPS